MTLIPAYGRTYSKREEVLADLNAGKDFLILDGPYINKEDMEDGLYFIVLFGMLKSSIFKKQNGVIL